MSVEKSEEIKERINLVVDTPDKLVPKEIKLELLLIILGYKKGTVVTLNSRSAASERFKAILIDSGFEVKAIKSQVSPDPGHFDLLISDNLEMIRRMEGLTIYNEAEWGDIYGYPKTAIEAFVGGKPGLSDLPDELAEDAELFCLADFVLSRENWRNEINTLVNWRNALREYAPVFLEAYVTEKEKRLMQ